MDIGIISSLGLAILNNAAKNILTHFCWAYPQSGMQGHQVHLCLALVNAASLQSCQQCMRACCSVVLMLLSVGPFHFSLYGWVFTSFDIS